MIKKRALLECIENKGCVRVTLKGLKNDYPFAYRTLFEALQYFEDYEFLQLLENEDADFDEKYLIYMLTNKIPFIIYNRSSYVDKEYKKIGKVIGVSDEDLQKLTQLD